MSVSRYASKKILQALFNKKSFSISSTYMALHTGDPGDSGANEVVGNKYARQQVGFHEADVTAINEGVREFPDMPECVITHIGIWDASKGGNFIWGGPFLRGKSINDGDTYRVPSGSLTAVIG